MDASIRSAVIQYINKPRKSDFRALALAVFRYQAAFNPVYREFLSLLGVKAASVQQLSDIPFLPISLFKKETLQTGTWSAEQVFSSSGTTSDTTSRHLLRSVDFYKKNVRTGFSFFYGNPGQYCWLALLPSYLEREGSSLVQMVQFFVSGSSYAQSGFFLYNTSELLEVLQECRQNRIPVILIGVSFALLDLAEAHPSDLSDIILMETGGMKGRRREITRVELHRQLQEAFQVPAIHSEYGMTELLSQAYSKGKGIFYPAPTMEVLIRDMTDPFAYMPAGRTGALNIIDLANVDTISFIATDDLGRKSEDGSFEVLGRMDNSDLRGCNLLLQEVR
jgi:phenylacetate-coenzyme A ligase PaaK-like adenylate-forming protein